MCPSFYNLLAATWAQFHQRSMYSFYACRAQKRKKDSQVIISLFTLSGSTTMKAECKYVGEIDTSQINVSLGIPCKMRGCFVDDDSTSNKKIRSTCRNLKKCIIEKPRSKDSADLKLFCQTVFLILYNISNKQKTVLLPFFTY